MLPSQQLQASLSPTEREHAGQGYQNSQSSHVGWTAAHRVSDLKDGEPLVQLAMHSVLTERAPSPQSKLQLERNGHSCKALPVGQFQPPRAIVRDGNPRQAEGSTPPRNRSKVPGPVASTFVERTNVTRRVTMEDNVVKTARTQKSLECLAESPRNLRANQEHRGKLASEEASVDAINDLLGANLTPRPASQSPNEEAPYSTNSMDDLYLDIGHTDNFLGLNDDTFVSYIAVVRLPYPVLSSTRERVELMLSYCPSPTRCIDGVIRLGPWLMHKYGSCTNSDMSIVYRLLTDWDAFTD
ncbi:uncharacterized protein B0I36DRAFT_393312 [Microdochium trichocladiopsis]|uniref:Uncharacterized protein n=1 Tax=Microdochium trichocladiopsis TaxID=1682393 RepID=A0A9P8XW82_9PEZI|nr:uncharacterized protein B0I36DRAFT_393312 [Microdochium trichocladiopsis]KAH7021051.1 hypothetical protein B0I36DRAFT_393312 [Microdochium trichocladiopsis]